MLYSITCTIDKRTVVATSVVPHSYTAIHHGPTKRHVTGKRKEKAVCPSGIQHRRVHRPSYGSRPPSVRSVSPPMGFKGEKSGSPASPASPVLRFQASQQTGAVIRANRLCRSAGRSAFYVCARSRGPSACSACRSRGI